MYLMCLEVQVTCNTRPRPSPSSSPHIEHKKTAHKNEKCTNTTPSHFIPK